MALRKERLESIRKQLLSRRQALATELTRATADFIDDEPSFSDSIDQAAADTDKTLAVHIANRDRNVLSEIDVALRRLEEGSFGECESCGESISDARMKAYPSTTLCIDCKTELESEQQRFSAGRV
jgi:DnaK suppressor protein